LPVVRARANAACAYGVACAARKAATGVSAAVVGEEARGVGGVALRAQGHENAAEELGEERRNGKQLARQCGEEIGQEKDERRERRDHEEDGRGEHGAADGREPD
jgi:hypothetical protein